MLVSKCLLLKSQSREISKVLYDYYTEWHYTIWCVPYISYALIFNCFYGICYGICFKGLTGTYVYNNSNCIWRAIPSTVYCVCMCNIYISLGQCIVWCYIIMTRIIVFYYYYHNIVFVYNVYVYVSCICVYSYRIVCRLLSPSFVVYI